MFTLHYFLINMARHTNENGANSNLTANNVNNDEILGVLGRMVDTQQ